MANESDNRKCILTNEIRNKNKLLRFTVLPNGDFVPDFNKKFGGKGVYISNSKSILEKAFKTVRIGKILHCNVNPYPELSELVEKILSAKGLEALNLARKSGNLVLGFDKVKENIMKNKVAFVVEANDAGKDGKEKMEALCKDIKKFVLYDSATLDKAFNRETTVYAAVLKSEISAMAYENLKRYENYLTDKI